MTLQKWKITPTILILGLKGGLVVFFLMLEVRGGKREAENEKEGIPGRKNMLGQRNHSSHVVKVVFGVPPATGYRSPLSLHKDPCLAEENI